MYIIAVKFHIDQVLYLGGMLSRGILSRGDFVPATNLPYSMYSNTVTIHIEQHMFLEDFVLGGRGGFYPLKDLVLCFSAPLRQIL